MTLMGKVYCLIKQGSLFGLSVLIDSISSSRILPLLSSSLHINITTLHFQCHTTKRGRGENTKGYMANPYTLLLRLTSIFIVTASAPELCGSSKTFTIVNYCKETIWPGITRSENFSGDGFTLKPGQSAVYTAPAGWSGRIWARTGCNFDKNGDGKCETGGCGTNINCTDPGSPPATIADFTLGQPDYYDVSLVDGFNLPIAVKAVNGTGNCSTAGCDGDLRQSCPSELATKENGRVIACRSACEVFDTDEYCCRGIYANPATCLPSNYSKTFKQVCPAAYSFAHDDPTSINTCSEADFIVTFCGSRNQTVCSYHNNQLLCNRSRAYKTIPQSWMVLMLQLLASHILSKLYAH